MSLVNMAAYNATLLTWLGYTLVKSPAREVSSTLLQSQRWEQSLTDIHHPLPENSLIPMFEGMVDRALSRNHATSTAALDAAAAAEVVPAVRRAAAVVGGLHLPDVAERFGSKS